MREDTCYFEGPHHQCTFEGNCPHRREDGICIAEDSELLTYEDYLQMKQTSEVKTQ